MTETLISRLMIEAEPQSLIGLVDGSVAATTSTFTAVLEPHATVQLDDLVTMRSALPDGTEVEHYGIVTEVSGQVDGASRASLDNVLLFSVFEPARYFDQPVRGSVVMSFSGVSVRG